jgi:hypothetical protein
VYTENLLIDFTQEIHGFLRVATQPFRPPFDLNEVLASVFSAISVYDCAESELTEVAIVLAYDCGYQEFRIEEADIPRGPHRDMFEAVMKMGLAMRDRLRFEYNAYLPPDGYFPYHFAEVHSDHLVRFAKADFEEFGPQPAPFDLFGSGYRL